MKLSQFFLNENQKERRLLPSLFEVFGISETYDEDIDEAGVPEDPPPNKHPGSSMPTAIGGKKKDQTGAQAADAWMQAKKLGLPPGEFAPTVPAGPLGSQPPMYNSRQQIWQATQDVLKGKGDPEKLSQMLGTATAMQRGDAVWKAAEKALDQARRDHLKARNAGYTAPGVPKKPGEKSPKVDPAKPVDPAVHAKIAQNAKDKPAPTSPFARLLQKYDEK